VMDSEAVGCNVKIELAGVFVFSAFVAPNTFGMFVNSA
jgi:hypothetical protein